MFKDIEGDPARVKQCEQPVALLPISFFSLAQEAAVFAGIKLTRGDDGQRGSGVIGTSVPREAR